MSSQLTDVRPRYLQAIARQERADLLALGMVTTHVHVLLRIVPVTVVPRLVQRMKGGSAHLAWKEGIGPFMRDKVGRYVLGQAEHHPDETIVGWHAASQLKPDITPRYHAVRV